MCEQSRGVWHNVKTGAVGLIALLANADLDNNLSCTMQVQGEALHLQKVLVKMCSRQAHMYFNNSVTLTVELLLAGDS